MHEKIFTLKVKICIHGIGVNGTSAMAERRIYVMREVVMNKKTNLLQLEEHFYQLADVKEPNVFHNLFPYDEIPKIAFNDRSGSQIRHFVTVSSQGHRIPQSRS